MANLPKVAKVKLKGAKSFTRASGTKWRQGQERILTKEADIRYYTNLPQFGVEPLPDSAAPAEAKPADAPPPPPKKGVFGGKNKGASEEEAPL